MNSREALKSSMEGSEFVANAYLADLSDAELLTRPLPDCNHIAWQLGHLIHAEHQIIDGVRPGSMPKLPEGFAERHAKEKAQSDNAADFLSKDEYLKLAKEQRAGTLALLETISDTDLDQPSPEPFRSFAPTVGALFTMQGTHWMMHAGQWAVIRRKLGKPPLF